LDESDLLLRDYVSYGALTFFFDRDPALLFVLEMGGVVEPPNSSRFLFLCSII